MITLALVGWGHVHATVVAGFHPGLIPDGGHREGGLGGRLSQLFRRVDFLMGSPFVNFQTIFCFEIQFTLIALKAFTLLCGLLVGFQTSP